MRNIWIFLVFLIVSCSGINPLPTNKGGNPGNPATDTATDTTTTTTTTDNTQFRPCVLVEETEFKANTSQDLWKPSYYFTPPAKYPVDLTDAGLILKGNGYRGGVTNTPVERDISSCPSMAFRVQGTVNDQSLGGAGWDNREAPIAIMIQYTDVSGVKHSTLTAFNEGEPDDRATTRMFWWGFGYKDPTNVFNYNNFTPNLTAVSQSVRFDKTINLFDKLTVKPKIIHTITIEGSGWAVDSVVRQFAMKPLEAFEDPQAPYRNGPTVKPTATDDAAYPGMKNVTNEQLQGDWSAVNPKNSACTRHLYFMDGKQFDLSQECTPYTPDTLFYRSGTYSVDGESIAFLPTSGSGKGSSNGFGFGGGGGQANIQPGSVVAKLLPTGQLFVKDSNGEITVFDKIAYAQP